MNFEIFLSEFRRAQDLGLAFVTVTLVDCLGSAPQEVGARMIVNSDGYFAGTVGGGKLEMFTIEKAKEYLREDKRGSFLNSWNLQTDIKMSCGGAVSLFFEIHNPRTSWNIAVFGAGHVVQELVRVLLRLEARITCYDTRKEWLDKLPHHVNLKIEHALDLPAKVSELSDSSFIVLATMGHATDLPILERILNTKQFSYLGVLGSDLKAKKMRATLLESKIPQEKLESFHCPMGEKFGNNTPAEIAISVTSQLLKVRDQVFGG